MSHNKEYTGYYADCYVLVNSRTPGFIYSFLDRFIPNRQETADAYEVPQYAEEPVRTYTTAEELINYLAEHKQEPHTIYWSNKEEDELKGAVCFFTTDGKIIAGLHCAVKASDSSIEERYFKELTTYCNSTIGYITYEEPAPHDTQEFLARVKSHKRTT